MMGARRFFVAAGIALRSVRIACASAVPHLQSRSAFPRSANDFADGPLHVFGIAIEVADDFLERDGAVLRVPAIVVGDHGEAGVADFGLAGELRFGQIGHADHVEAQLPVGVRLGQRRKLRAFHADVGAAAMRLHAGAVAGVGQMRGKLRAGGLVEADVRDDAAAEESGDATAACGRKTGRGSRNRAAARSSRKRAHRAHGNDPLDAQHLHGADVGAVVDFARRDQRGRGRGAPETRRAALRACR